MSPAANCRWPRAVRLSRNEDIRRTIRRGRCFPGDGFRFFFWPQPPSCSVRFAISVRKKVGNACKRNRERRQFREALRISRRLWPRQGWGVVVIDRPSASFLTWSKRQETIGKLLAQVARTLANQTKRIG